MNRVQELDAIVGQFDLNKHPFYQDWRMGTLATEKIASYAAEYGAFVDTIDEGWDTIGETAYAVEERHHEELWTDFQIALHVAPGSKLDATQTLVAAARNNFRSPATAVGALYSFEAQQPHTSASKLAGLNEHYEICDHGKEYFRVHADDFAEAESLRARIASMSDEEFAQTKTACAVVCAAMWGALDAVYYK